MKRNTIGYLVVLSLAIAGCGSDSPSEQLPSKDAAADSKDAPTAGSDVLATADVPDMANTYKPDAADTPEAADGPAATSDAPKPQPDAIDLPAVTDAHDAVADAGIADLAKEPDAIGERPTFDTNPYEAPFDSPAVVPLPCRGDSDCCIEIDSCMNIAYLYSKAPGAPAPPTIQPPSGGMCTACMIPTIQVRCVSGQCTGDRIAGYPSTLMTGHCGYVALPDGGVTALQDVIDAGAISTKTVWTCSGG
jgi:hypothetical protein